MEGIIYNLLCVIYKCYATLYIMLCVIINIIPLLYDKNYLTNMYRNNKKSFKKIKK